VGSKDFRRVAKEPLLVFDLFDFDSVEAAVVSSAAFADLACCALMVELEEEVEDSRTGGRVLRVASLIVAPATLEVGRGRSGLLVAYLASIAVDVTTPLE
jgi:hypothetical protein